MLRDTPDPQLAPRPTDPSVTGPSATGPSMTDDIAGDMAGAADAMTDLVALVGSRLCHDLISPLGAIGNGVELLAMAGTGMSPELQLIAESVAAANARVKFFRVAFGQAGAEQRLGRSEIISLLDDISRSGRLKIEWLAEGDQTRRQVKLAFLAVLCLEAALPWGGTLRIGCTGGQWQLRAEGRRTKPDPALWAALDGSPAALGPAQVQFALLPREAAALGRAVTWSVTAETAEISY